MVATEVRTLAQRSAAAAKEIKELINDSVTKVDEGTKLVDEAGSTMDEIVTAVKRVTDIMSEISAASQEQSSGIEQINQAVTQMDEVTQQNAALVEEASAAAESMKEQSKVLIQAVSVFKFTNHGEQAAATKNSGVVTLLPNRGSATRKATVNTKTETAPEKLAMPTRKVASGVRIPSVVYSIQENTVDEHTQTHWLNIIESSENLLSQQTSGFVQRFP